MHIHIYCRPRAIIDPLKILTQGSPSLILYSSNDPGSSIEFSPTHGVLLVGAPGWSTPNKTVSVGRVYGYNMTGSGRGQPPERIFGVSGTQSHQQFGRELKNLGKIGEDGIMAVGATTEVIIIVNWIFFVPHLSTSRVTLIWITFFLHHIYRPATFRLISLPSSLTSPPFSFPPMPLVTPPTCLPGRLQFNGKSGLCVCFPSQICLHSGQRLGDL